MSKKLTWHIRREEPCPSRRREHGRSPRSGVRSSEVTARAARRANAQTNRRAAVWGVRLSAELGVP